LEKEMINYICDKCKEEIKKEKPRFTLTRADNTKIDLCKDCDDLLDRFLQGEEI
jgi:hypothetical protein